MKTKSMLAALMIALALPLTALAGGDKEGNGGDGVKIGDQVYLFDLVEAGVHLDPKFAGGEAHSWFLDRTRATFSGKKDFPVELVARKLSEIAHVNVGFAIGLMRTMELYTWRWVDLDLINIPDDGDTVLDLDRSKLVQLAVRYKRAITISTKQWESLSVGNRAALIFHEAVYSLIRITENWRSTHQYPMGIQDAALARQITGYLFSDDLVRRGRLTLSALIANLFPSSAGDFARVNPIGGVEVAFRLNVNVAFDVRRDGRVTGMGRTLAIPLSQSEEATQSQIERACDLSDIEKSERGKAAVNRLKTEGLSEYQSQKFAEFTREPGHPMTTYIAWDSQMSTTGPEREVPLMSHAECVPTLTRLVREWTAEILSQVMVFGPEGQR